MFEYSSIDTIIFAGTFKRHHFHKILHCLYHPTIVCTVAASVSIVAAVLAVGATMSASSNVAADVSAACNLYSIPASISTAFK